MDHDVFCDQLFHPLEAPTTRHFGAGLLRRVGVSGKQSPMRVRSRASCWRSMQRELEN